MSSTARPKGSRPATTGSFKPGHTINAKSVLPRGRWITRQLISQLNEEMDDPEFDPKNKKTVAKRAKVIYFFCKKLIALALEGDTTAIKMVMDRIEGTPISTVQFKDIPDGAETPEQAEAIEATRERIKDMTPDELKKLYRDTIDNRTSITQGTRTQGSA